MNSLLVVLHSGQISARVVGASNSLNSPGSTPIELPPNIRFSAITKADIDAAAAEGCKLKLIAHATLNPDGTVKASVAPEKIANTHPLAGVSNEFNAVYITGDMVDEVMFYGKGAGALPTGSAIVGDIISVAKSL